VVRPHFEAVATSAHRTRVYDSRHDCIRALSLGVVIQHGCLIIHLFTQTVLMNNTMPAKYVHLHNGKLYISVEFRDHITVLSTVMAHVTELRETR